MHSMSFSSPFARALRNAAPNLSRRFFDCRRCQNATPQFAKNSTQARPSLSRSVNTAVIQSKRFASTVAASNLTQPVQAQAKRGSSFPETSSNAVAYWLLGSAASVFGIVVFGGWTRLTESGYCNLPIFPRTLLTTRMQIEHHRMEACNWLSSTYV